jgi:hypothetical protein
MLPNTQRVLHKLVLLFARAGAPIEKRDYVTSLKSLYEFSGKSFSELRNLRNIS